MAVRRALLLIDVLNDFLTPEGKLYCGEGSRKIIPRLRELIDEFHSRKDPVIYICDEHAKDDPEFKLFGEHGVEGTHGAEVIPELAPKSGDVVLKKRRLNTFQDTGLEGVLRKLRVEEAHVVGVCTSICVMETVSGLACRDVAVVVHRDAVADFDQEAHRFALTRMGKVFGARME